MRHAARGGAIAFLVLLVGGSPSVAVHREPWARSSARTLAELPVAARATISRVLGRDQPRYRTSGPAATPVLTNDAQRLTARFDRRGFVLRSAAIRFGLSLRAVGRGERLYTAAPASPRARANRVDYRRGPLTEWYANGPLGLEQGFTLQRAPTAGAGPLTLELGLSGATPTLLPGRTGLSFANSALRYRGLYAADANGKTLRAWLELRGRTLLIHVADHDARYPVTIDPFVQQAKLVATENTFTDLGSSVAVSGDTVVVGSPSATAGVPTTREPPTSS